MFGVGISELVLLALLPVAVVVLFVRVLAGSSGRTPVPSGSEERRVRLVRLAGIVLGLLAGAWPLMESVPFSRGLGTDLVLAPMLFGLVVLLAAVVGELVVRPRFDTSARVADLRPRRVRDHLPQLLTPALAIVLVMATALCAFTVLTASSDDMGRAGRALAYACLDGSMSTRSPYPGSFYVTPYALGVLLALAVALLAAWRITRRTLGGTPEQADRYRSLGMRAIVGALGVVVAGPLTGIAFFAGWALNTHECVPAAYGLVGVPALVLALAAAVTAVVSLISLVVPARYVARETVRA